MLLEHGLGMSGWSLILVHYEVENENGNEEEAVARNTRGCYMAEVQAGLEEPQAIVAVSAGPSLGWVWRIEMHSDEQAQSEDDRAVLASCCWLRVKSSSGI